MTTPELDPEYNVPRVLAHLHARYGIDPENVMACSVDNSDEPIAYVSLQLVINLAEQPTPAVDEGVEPARLIGEKTTLVPLIRPRPYIDQSRPADSQPRDAFPAPDPRPYGQALCWICNQRIYAYGWTRDTVERAPGPMGMRIVEPAGPAVLTDWRGCKPLDGALGVIEHVPAPQGIEYLASPPA